MTKQYDEPTKLAVFESIDRYPCRVLYTEEEGKHTTWARITDWVEVSFPKRTDVEVTQEKVDSLDKEIAETWAGAKAKVDKLAAVKAELLALQFDQDFRDVEKNLSDSIAD